MFKCLQQRSKQLLSTNPVALKIRQPIPSVQRTPRFVRILIKLCPEQFHPVYRGIKAVATLYGETFVSTPMDRSHNLTPWPGDAKRIESLVAGGANKIPYLRISVILLRRRRNGPAFVVSRRVEEDEESGGWLRPRMRESLRERSRGWGARGQGRGLGPGGITMRSNVVNINETKVISVFLFFFF